VPNRRLTFSKFIIEEEQRRRTHHDGELTALLNDIQTACKFIASAVSRGSLDAATGRDTDDADEILVRETEWGGKLAGILSATRGEPYPIPSEFARGKYLLVVEALDGSSALDVNHPAGTIFSILVAPPGKALDANAFLQAGTAQIAAGFALYGPTSVMVVTLGAGTHGFTLDREIGAYTLTNANMQIPETTREVAIDSSNRRHWEDPVRQYVEELLETPSDGSSRGEFVMRWADSTVAEVYRILVRGGVFIDPCATKEGCTGGNLQLLFQANPMAMIVEQAGGTASTGRARILDVEPTAIEQRVPVILGSAREVDRLASLHAQHDRGESLAFATPLFRDRSLFR